MVGDREAVRVLDLLAKLRDGSHMLADMQLSQAYSGKNVLVTGGAGFIGSHLVETLVEYGASVRVLDDLSTGNRANCAAVANRIEFIQGDIRNPDTCRKAAKDIELVFHEAALVSVPDSISNPARAYDINITGTSHLFEAAHECHAQRVVYASSSAVYGDSKSMPLSEECCGRLMSPYAVGKRTCELVAEYAYKVRGLTSFGLRYFNVYGSRQSPDSPYAAVIPIFIARLRAGRAPLIHGDGLQTRDFVSVKDVVRANLLAGVAQQVEASVANVGTGVAISVTRLAELLCELLAPTLRPEHGPARSGDIAQSVASTAKAEQLLGFRANIPFDSGIAQLVNG